MNVGDYIRTREYIRKIRKIERGYIYCDIGVFTENEIIKTSPQIIDLIEVGDYVNDNCVIEAVPKDKRKKQIIIVDSTCAEYGDLPLNNKDIKTVVTHEQMEAMQYRVEE